MPPRLSDFVAAAGRRNAVSNLRKLADAAAKCACAVCMETAESSGAPFFAQPYCETRRAFREAASPEALRVLYKTLRDQRQKLCKAREQRDALRVENEAFRKDARCPSIDPKTGYRCEDNLDHGCELHCFETYTWDKKEQRVYCPKGCGLMYLPSRARDHSCADS